jgi:hypothetical protein
MEKRLGGRLVMVYFGIVNEQSLKNLEMLEEISIVAKRQKGSMNSLLVLAYEDELENLIKKLQENMVPINEECWCNYFFLNDSLTIVFQDAVIKTSTNPDEWEEAIQYGTKHEISKDQLEFNPCTKDDAFELFDLE